MFLSGVATPACQSMNQPNRVIVAWCMAGPRSTLMDLIGMVRRPQAVKCGRLMVTHSLGIKPQPAQAPQSITTVERPLLRRRKWAPFAKS